MKKLKVLGAGIAGACVIVLALLANMVQSTDISNLTGYTGKIGEEDINWGSGVDTDTFTVKSAYAPGGTITLTKVPSPFPETASIIKGSWYPSTSNTITDHGDATISGSIAWVIAQIGSDEATVVLPGNTSYPLLQNLSIPANVSLAPSTGAVITTNGHTLTFASGSHLIDNGGRQMFDAAAGEVVLADSTVYAANPVWWGAVGDGATDNTVALQSAINATSHGPNRVYIPAGIYLYTKIYTHYSATLNPTFNGALPFDASPLIIEGAGCMYSSVFYYASAYDTTDGYPGTVLRSTVTTGNAFNIGIGTPYASRSPASNQQIRNISFLGETTGRIIDCAYPGPGFVMENVFIGMKADIAGTGLHINNGWGGTWRNIQARSLTAEADVIAGTYASVGIYLNVYDEGYVDFLTGGDFLFEHVTAEYFDTGLKLNGPQSAYFLHSNTMRCRIGTRVTNGANYTFDQHYSEFDYSVAMNLLYANNIRITNSHIDLTNASSAGIALGYAAPTSGDLINVTIEGVRFYKIGENGAAAIKRYQNVENIKISQIYAEMSADPFMSMEVAVMPDLVELSNVKYVATSGSGWLYNAQTEVLSTGSTDYRHKVDWGRDTRRGEASGVYDFAVNGGAVATHVLGRIPDNAIITRAFYEVITEPTSDGAAQIQVGPTTDSASMVPLTAYNDAIFGAGVHDCTQDGTAANFVTKTTAARNIDFVIAAAALTAGKIYFWWEWIVSE